MIQDVVLIFIFDFDTDRCNNINNHHMTHDVNIHHDSAVQDDHG